MRFDREKHSCGQNGMARGTITRSIEDAARIWDIFTWNEFKFEDEIDIFSKLNIEHFQNKKIAFLIDLPYKKVDPQISKAMNKLYIILSKNNNNVKKINTLGFSSDPDDAAGILWRRKTKTMVEQVPTVVDEEPYLKKLADSCVNLTKDDIERALKVKSDVIETITKFFDDFDFLIIPSVAVLPRDAGEGRPQDNYNEKLTDFSFNPFTYIFNWTDCPSITLPLAFSEGVSPLPIGVQVVARNTFNKYKDNIRCTTEFKELLGFATVINNYCLPKSSIGAKFPKLRYEKGSCCKINLDK